MTDFSIRCIWEEDPGVPDPVLARTWAQVGIWVGGEPIIQFHSLRSNSVKNTVYGSVFPLAAWIVENWWFLVNEGAHRLAVVRGAREVMRLEPALRFWLRRHNLLTAREGYALPDLSVFRDGALAHLCWTVDPEDDFPRRGRFIAAGWCRLEGESLQNGLREFVEVVLERVDGIASEDVTLLRERWLAVQELEAEEPVVSASLAALGVHPCSPAAEDAGLRAAIEHLATLPSSLRQDLLDATSAEHLRDDLGQVAQWLQSIHGTGTGPWHIPTDVDDATGKRAFEAGYLRARRIRKAWALGPERPLDDLAGHIQRQLGQFEQHELTASASTGTRIDALVAHPPGSEARTLVGPPRSERAGRFRLGRALHQWSFTPRSVGLLTRSQSGWEQRASRAFAAELLAPASGIRAELERSDGDGIIGQLARRFAVDETVIAFQIENHAIEVP